MQEFILHFAHTCIKFSYPGAAKCYAQTQVSFEEVALKFIQVEERQALRMFLLKKLDSLKNQVKLNYSVHVHVLECGIFLRVVVNGSCIVDYG